MLLQASSSPAPIQPAPGFSSRAFLGQPGHLCAWQGARPSNGCEVSGGSWAPAAPPGPSRSLAAEVFLLELLEVLLREHSAFSLLLLLLFGHRPVTGLAAPILAQNLGMCRSQDMRELYDLVRSQPFRGRPPTAQQYRNVGGGPNSPHARAETPRIPRNILSSPPTASFL